MRSGDILLKFDLADLITRARRQWANRGGRVTISLPGLSFQVNPLGIERQTARELMIRLRDRRVLSAWECCDSCIADSLASLREIRSLLVDKQVAVAELQDGPLFLLVEAMLSGIRQFMTFEERLRRSGSDVRQGYFDGLEVLRAHLSGCIVQIAAIAGMPPPEPATPTMPDYRNGWELEAYRPLEMPPPREEDA